MSCLSARCIFPVLLAVLGVLFVVLGLAAFLFVPKIINEAVKRETFLGQDANGTDNTVLKMFRDPPYDIRLQVWTMSVQNADKVVKNGAKPELVEKGPYTFNVRMHKTNVSFGENRTRLFFRNRRTYFFNRSQSCADCELADKVTVPNILFQKLVDLGLAYPKTRIFIDLLLTSKEKVFINISVDELLFKGYEDALISSICEKYSFTRAICGIPKGFRIGLFYGQNNTDDGLYEVDTGSEDTDLLDRVYSFNGMHGNLSDKHWYGELARQINGTDAELFRPNLLGRPKLQIFIGQLCRSFDLEVWGATSTADIPVWRYSQPDSSLGVDEQRLQGFCNPNSPDFYHNHTIQQAKCAPSGLLDMSSCLPGSPRIFFSGAHLRNAPEGVRESLAGPIAAPSDADRSYFDIEPITGVVVGVQQRYQLNLGMLRGNLRATRNMSDLILPMIWMNESAAIDPATRSQLLVAVNTLSWAFIGGLLLFTAGAVFLVCFAGLLVGFKIADAYNRSRPSEEEHLIADHSEADDDAFLPAAQPQVYNPVINVPVANTSNAD